MAYLPEGIESCWTPAGFNEVFEHFTKEGITYVEAYRKTEEEHVRKFGRIKYKSYESFREVRKRMLFGG